MIHIHRVGLYNSVTDTQNELKTELKALTGKPIRRIDHFIELTLLGALQAAKPGDIPGDTALYMTSGQGDLSVFKRVRNQKFIEKLLPKPVDFINMLSNTAGFYVAKQLGLSGKNLFTFHHAFPVQMALLLAKTDLQLGRQSAAFVGGVDEVVEPLSLTRRRLGIAADAPMGEGSNWCFVSPDAAGALASLEVIPRVLDAEGVREQIASLPQGARVAFGMRCESEDHAMLDSVPDVRRYGYESECGFYETLSMYVLGRFVEEEEGTLLHIERFEERYMVMRLDVSANSKRGDNA